MSREDDKPTEKKVPLPRERPGWHRGARVRDVPQYVPPKLKDPK